MHSKVLIIDDEPAVRDMLCFALNKAQMQPLPVAGASEALLAISNEKPDIILMDWMTSGISGLELTRRLRKDPRARDIPIIMLTARATEDSRVTGLDAGSDDYVSKPFSTRELIARIKAVLRRTRSLDDNDCLRVGSLKLDLASHRITHDNVELHLGPTDFKLLAFFMSRLLIGILLVGLIASLSGYWLQVFLIASVAYLSWDLDPDSAAVFPLAARSMICGANLHPRPPYDSSGSVAQQKWPSDSLKLPLKTGYLQPG